MDRQLPILTATGQPQESPRKQPRRFSWVAYLSRLLVVAAAVSGLSAAANKRAATTNLTNGTNLSLSAVQSILPAADRLQVMQLGNSTGNKVLDASGKEIGLVITTSPEADKIIGYSGPNNVLLLFDHKQQIQGAKLLSSGDTVDHAKQVEASEKFWSQFHGLKLGESLKDHSIDGVSGATLTSLAIAEAIQLRLSGQRQSLRFPDPITLDEARLLMPTATQIDSEPDGDLLQLSDANNQLLGWIHRTGPQIDSEEGYQGPTEALLLFDADHILRNVKIRRSYDNEPYVGYVRQEYSFWAKFKGRSFAELATLDVELEEIEGVSGATMTSLAVARTIAGSLQRVQAQQAQQNQTLAQRSWHWSTTEIITAAIALLGIAWSRSRLRGRPVPRFVWQLFCLICLGLYAGNLLSLALLAGWTRGGIQFKLAPGLSLLLIVALVWPMLTKQNLYCDHICPHGALQQWLIRFRKRKRVIAPISQTANANRRNLIADGIFGILAVTPILALISAAGWLLLDWPIHLAWLEPFDAYSWRIGLSVSLAVWGIGILVSYLRPMSYCRIMCPTGKLLGYLRRGQRGPLSLMADLSLLIVSIVAWSYA